MEYVYKEFASVQWTWRSGKWDSNEIGLVKANWRREKSKQRVSCSAEAKKKHERQQ